MKKWLISGILPALIATQAQAATPAQGSIARYLTKELKDDFVHTSRAKMLKAIKQIDIDGDAIPDWTVDFEGFDSPAWCGTGGCRLVIWHGLPGGKVKIALDQQVREHHWQGRTLITDLHGSNCGGTGNQACPTNFVWNAAKGTMAEQPRPRKFHYHM